MSPPSSRAPLRSRLGTASQPVVVFGVIPAAAMESGAKTARAELLVVRHLGALLEDVTLGVEGDLAARVARYRAVVEEAFGERAIVPAPFGTVFRSRASVGRWLELHYSPLQDALDFVVDRATMRVRVSVADAAATGRAAEVLDGTLWSVLRGLKGDAIAAIPIAERVDGSSRNAHGAECAYLIDRDAVTAFQRRVASLTSAESQLRVDLAGPLPAYDFVKMDFGG